MYELLNKRFTEYVQKICKKCTKQCIKMYEITDKNT